MLALWQAIGSWTQGVAVSPPLQTLVYLFGLLRTWMFWDHAAATLEAFCLAFVLSALIGLALGLIFGISVLPAKSPSRFSQASTPSRK